MPDRRTGGAYPFWVGLLALLTIGLVWPWGGAEPPPGADTGAPDAGAVDAAPPPPPPPIVWTVEGRAAPEVGVLGACLRKALKRRALVNGQPPRLTITAPGLRRPQVLAVDGSDLRIETPSDVDPRLSTAVHTATAACLRAGAARLSSPAGRQWTPDQWPRLGPGGGAPLDAFVQAVTVDQTTRSVGLARFGRPEVVAQGTGEAAADAVRAAAVQLFIRAPKSPTAVPNPAGPGRLLAAAPWWPGGQPAGHWALAHPSADRPWAPAPATKRPAPPRPPVKPATRRRKAPARPAGKRPRRPRRPATRAPVFLPDYR